LSTVPPGRAVGRARQLALGNQLTGAAIVSNSQAKPVLVTAAGLLAAGTTAFFALDATAPLR
jgi:hypothetical protein